jgi:hypothetical protein
MAAANQRPARQPASTGGRWTMWVIFLEALAALALLVFIVWWTMFSGRPRGERRGADREAADGDDRPGS